MKPSIVIIDCNRNGLACIRSLSSAGYKIIALDHRRLSPGIYSRHIDKLHFVPTPHADEDGFIQSLIKVGSDNKTGSKYYLLPVNDTYVRSLALHWERLSKWYVPLFEIDNATLEDVTNKLAFSRFCERINIPRPAEYTVENVLADQVSYPIIFKPDERNTVENLRKKIFKVKISESSDDAKAFIAELKRDEIQVIIQQLIPGGDDELYTAGVSAKDGKLLACFTGKKVRQFPPTAGQAALAMATDCPKIVEYAQRIVTESKFTGLSQIEFKHHAGEYYVIEMNPRSWSWHGLAKPAGVDLPKILLDAFEANEIPNHPIVNSVNGIYWHYFLEDLYYHFILSKNLSLRELIHTWRMSKAHAFYDSKDPLPVIAHLLIQYPIRLIKWVIGFQDRLSRIN
ncbi:ATP-grasp domain-containing protein [Salibacteraceae bacterium]|nr:ATP-grasp domain-containing protein [Salibacteraceae bacterium]